MTVTKSTLDLAHSEVQFKIKHLMISTVTGSFRKIDATVGTNGNDFTNAKINFAAVVSLPSLHASQANQLTTY